MVYLVQTAQKAVFLIMIAEAPKFVRSSIDFAHRNILYPFITRGAAQQDREIAHERAISLMENIQKSHLLMTLMRKLFAFEDPRLKTEFAGMTAPNPLGFAAGLDKNARVHRFLGEALTFGIVKVGSITLISYYGNERPRIFELIFNDGIINRMGFPGEGSDEAEKRLIKDEKADRKYTLVVNIAASRPSFDRGSAIADYVAVAKQLLQYGDGHEVNVSSPNTPGVRGLQEPDVFSDLASELKNVYSPNETERKPLLYKFSPDLDFQKLQEDIKIAVDNGATGITLTNTTTDPQIRENLKPDKHKNEAGGISGAPLTQKALELTHRVYEYTGGQVPINRVGGIRTAEDVWNALTYGGASVVDVYTAFVRPTTSTPNFAFYILHDLSAAMRAEGMTSMEDFKSLRGKRVLFPNIS